tara:strand:- start:205 stop:312 length:108 start_codon:yes stop_codon:yes gene_type:complete
MAEDPTIRRLMTNYDFFVLPEKGDFVLSNDFTDSV